MTRSAGVIIKWAKVYAWSDANIKRLQATESEVAGLERLDKRRIAWEHKLRMAQDAKAKAGLMLLEAAIEHAPTAR